MRLLVKEKRDRTSLFFDSSEPQIPSEPQMSFLINGWRSVFGASSGATLSRKGVNGSGGLSFFVSFHRCQFLFGLAGSGREDNKKERTPPRLLFPSLMAGLLII